VATIKDSSCGALAIEKLRTFPSESVSEGSSKVISRYWPALNAHPDGFSNRKAMVPFATSLRSFSLQLKPGDAAAVLIIVSFRYAPRSIPVFVSFGEPTNLVNQIPASWLKYW
jgi:hypothetical protein